MPEAAPSVPDSGETSPLAIVAGGGRFPFAVADAVLRAGRPVKVFAIRGFADPDVTRYPHQWVHLGAFGVLIAAMKASGCRQVVFVGSLVRPRLRQLRLDWFTIRRLPRLASLWRGGDNHLLSGGSAMFEEQGLRLVGAHEAAPDILIPAGPLGMFAPSAAALAEARLGLDTIRALGPFDIGQAVVAAHRRIIAVEAAEGTDLMLNRVAELRALGRFREPAGQGVFVKAPKPGQDRRLDLPSIGPATVASVAAAGLGGIVVEAGGVMAAEMQAMIEAADAAGIFLYGLAP